MIEGFVERMRALDLQYQDLYVRPLSYEPNLGCKEISAPDPEGRICFTAGLADNKVDLANAEICAHALSDLRLLHNGLLTRSRFRRHELAAQHTRWEACSPLPWSIKIADDSLHLDDDGEAVAIFHDTNAVRRANVIIIATVYVPELLPRLTSQ